jgi:hypothetical protein
MPSNVLSGNLAENPSMATINELETLLSEPREDLSVEYKDWLDLSANNGRATIAKAAIALANHGGGFIVLGFAESQNGFVSQARPEELPPITQDAVNAAVRRFADPEFHVEVYHLTHPITGIEHVVVGVPEATVPVMSKRACENVLLQNRCYIRKPGPRSEEPQTGEEWRMLLNRCVRAQREDMLDAIRAIVTGRIEVGQASPTAEEELVAFAEAAHQRWAELVADLPTTTPAKFPHGYYEMAFALAGAAPAANLADLQDRLAAARRIKLTGWSTFLAMSTPGWSPYPHEDFVEAWVGRPVREDAASREPAHCDFWRASRHGQLYTIRGYAEDGLPNRQPGTCFDVTMPVWRVAEGLLFASRLAETFEGVEQILIRCRFTGLEGRALVSVTGNRAVFGDDVSQTNDILLQARATPGQVRDNLAEIMLQLLTPLYERFNFVRLPMSLVEEELQRLRQGRF